MRGALKGIPVFSLLSGEPEYLDTLKDDAPVGWVVTGYPWNDIKTPEHLRFLNAYRERYNDYPRVGSVAGYLAFYALAAAIEKAGSLDTNKVITAFEGLTVASPFGPVTFRAVDHASTMGTYVGRTSTSEMDKGNGRLAVCRWQIISSKR